MSVLFKTLNSKKQIEKMDYLINLLSGVPISLIPGQSPKTDGISKIWVPWLGNEATEEDVLKFYCYVLHEWGHFFGKSDVPLLNKIASTYGKRKKSFFLCVNAVDDIRCENNQEHKYPGLLKYRVPYYNMSHKEFVEDMLLKANKNEMGPFIRSLLIYLISKIRYEQIGLKIDMKASVELMEAYDEYILDLEDRVRAQLKFDESVELGRIIYKRIKHLIKDEVQPPQKGKGDSQPQSGDEEQESESGSSSSSDKEEKDDSKEFSDKDGEQDSSGSEDEQEEEEGSEDSSDTGDKDSEGDTDDGTDEGDQDGGSSDSSSDGGSDEDSDDDNNDTSDEDESEGGGDLSDEKLEEEMDKLFEELEENADTINDELQKEIQKIGDTQDPYLVDSNVKDDIAFNRTGDLSYAKEFLKAGVKILGSEGKKMTKNFISYSKPRTTYNQRHGRFDMRTYLSDPMDQRTDVFTDKTGAKLDKAAVSILMDNSGSMNRVLNKAYSVMSGMLHYISRSRIPAEVSGFTGSNNYSKEMRDGPILIRVVKAFDEPYSNKIISRCVPPSQSGNTPTLDGLRWAAKRLYQRPEPKKIFFVVTDGLPGIGDYSLNQRLYNGSKEYIELCRKVGIITVGFGLNCNLSGLFGDDYINISGNTMGSEMSKKLAEILNRKRAL